MANSNPHHFSCPHHHDFIPENHQMNERRTWFVIGLTLITMIIEIVSGLLFGSMALLADGWHMASHASAMGITAMAYYFVKKHRENPRFSFGTGKINELAGYSSALLLAIIALLMAYESICRLLDPKTIHYTEAMIVAIAGLLVNLVSALILKEDTGHHHTHAHDHACDHDHNLRAAYIHVLADAMTSILAIVALLFGKLYDWAFLDPVMGIVGALVISRWAYGLMKETGKVLLDYNNNSQLLRDVRESMHAAGASSVDDLHLWRVGQGAYSAVIAVSSDTTSDPGAYKAALCHLPQLAHVIVEISQNSKKTSIPAESLPEN